MTLEQIKALLISGDWVRSHCERCRTKARTHRDCVIEWLIAEAEKGKSPVADAVGCGAGQCFCGGCV